MSVRNTGQVRTLAETLRQRPSRRAHIKRLVAQQPMGAVAALFLILMILVAIFADFIATHNPYTMNSADLIQPPGSRYLFGTDHFGRDVFSRVVYGSRISLVVGLTSIGIGVVIGALFGLVSGYWGGTTVDTLIQRVMDALMSLPMLVFAISIVAVLGPSVPNVVIAIGIVMVPRTSRVVRGSTLSVRENQYIEAARALGCGTPRILLQHILPNVFTPIIIVASVELGNAILTEASLSFLGYGVPQPEPSWGGMLSLEGLAYMEIAPWVAISPGLALSLAVLSFNLFGDSLRDVLDPRLRT